MNECERAIILSHRVLDRISADPDDDLATLSRQFLRSVEREERTRSRIAQMVAALEAAKGFGSQGDTHEGISVSYLIDEALKAARDG